MPKNDKILYIDMDNVLVDFPHALDRQSPELLAQYKDRHDEIPDLFEQMPPLPGAIESFSTLARAFDTYILSTAPWNNSSAWYDKVEWVKKHLGEIARKRLILSHHKHLNRGDFLIDDREKNGAERFHEQGGELILFGSPKFPDWPTVLEYLLKRR